SDVARGVLQSLRSWRFARNDKNEYTITDDPNGLRVTALPAARALVSVEIAQKELGQMVLSGYSGFAPSGSTNTIDTLWDSPGPCAVGMSPAIQQPENERANAKFADDPTLRRHVSVLPQPSCPPTSQPRSLTAVLPSPSGGGAGPE